jgi:hypothetical protein
MIEELRRRPCDWCGGLFYVGRVDHRFCSMPCHNKFHAAEKRQAIKYFRDNKVPLMRDQHEQQQVGSAA